MINSTTFGEIVVNGKTHEHDIYIFPDEHIERRDEGHRFSKKEIELLNCNVIVFGNGQSGVGYVDEESKEFARANNVKLTVERTPKAIQTFNKLKCEKAAAIHVTC